MVYINKRYKCFFLKNQRNKDRMKLSGKKVIPFLKSASTQSLNVEKQQQQLSSETGLVVT